MNPRICPQCQTALAEDKPRNARFCSDLCRYRFRDAQPATRAADTERHRRRYHADAEFRAAHNRACVERQRKRRERGAE